MFFLFIRRPQKLDIRVISILPSPPTCLRAICCHPESHIWLATHWFLAPGTPVDPRRGPSQRAGPPSVSQSQLAPTGPMTHQEPERLMIVLVQCRCVWSPARLFVWVCFSVDTTVAIIVSVSLAVLVCAVIPLIFYRYCRSDAGVVTHAHRTLMNVAIRVDIHVLIKSRCLLACRWSG